MSWTDERVELLRQLWLDGKSASQISRALGAGLTPQRGDRQSPSSGPGGTRQDDRRRRRPRGAAARPREPRRLRAAPSAASATAWCAAIRRWHMRPKQRCEAQPMRHGGRSRRPDVAAGDDRRTKESMCRWPLGDPTTSGFPLLRLAAAGAGPYCTHHGRIAYQPVQDRRRERDRDARCCAVVDGTLRPSSRCTAAAPAPERRAGVRRCRAAQLLPNVSSKE